MLPKHRAWRFARASWTFPPVSLLPSPSLVYLVIVLLIAAAPGPGEGLSCGKCDPDLCTPLPEPCAGGSTKDICNCCLVCAKVLNETCGGKYGMLGQCGPGLRCFISPTPGQAITGHEEGICKVYDISNCTRPDCEPPVSYECPEDSDLVSNRTGAEEVLYCQCNQTKCQRPNCTLGFHSHLLSEGTGVPGHCCDHYVCKTSVECQSVICPHVEERECPRDSVKSPKTLTEDGCCVLHQSCRCQDPSLCPPVVCPPGQLIQVVAKATNVPGSCCDKFQCVNDTGYKCQYDRHEFGQGETWQLDKCTSCTCDKGLTFCKTKTCNGRPLCGWMVIPDGDCCPVCKGCVSDSGQLYNNSEVWREGDCMTCQCDAGQILCQAETCAVPCSNPRKVPGRCCPVCDDVDTLKPPELCVPDEECTLTCTEGLVRAEEGCFLCQCKPEPCDLDCKYGLKKDKDGEEICECAEPISHCPDMDSCTKQCTYGFRKARNGCLKCRCNRCPPFNCTKRCLHGYHANDQGCQLCKCREAPLSTDLPEVTTADGETDWEREPGVEGKSCMSLEGQRHEDGESWHDGCRLCYCQNGREMCSLIACPVPRCSSPIFRVGDCCPTCPELEGISSQGEKESCRATNGQNLVEGETWQLDMCTRCICHSGVILCETHTCPPVLCNNPVKPPGHCCAMCEGDIPIVDVGALKLRPCRVESGAVYHHGDKWQAGPCQSCMCHLGQKDCFNQMCVPSNCNKTVHQKGKCCPVCMDVEPAEVCVSDGVTYSTGEMWLRDNCTECLCSSGHIICIPISCPQLSCSVMVRRPSQCCPVCYEEAMSSPAPTNRNAEADYSDEKMPEVPTENFSRKENYVIAISTLGVLLTLALITLAIIVLYLLRRRHKGKFKMKSETAIMTDLKIRPKSTNLDYQGVMPFLLDPGSPGKPVNKERNLEKHYVALGPVITAEKPAKITDFSTNHYVNDSADPPEDLGQGNFKTNKTFEPV